MKMLAARSIFFTTAFIFFTADLIGLFIFIYFFIVITFLMFGMSI